MSTSDLSGSKPHLRSVLSGIQSSDNSVLQEVIPVQYHNPWRKEQFFYIKIKVEKLTRMALIGLFRDKNSRSELRVIESPRYFITQFEDKPPIYINRQNGRLYCLDMGYDLKNVEHQASFIIRILRSVGLVEDCTSKTMIVKNQKDYKTQTTL